MMRIPLDLVTFLVTLVLASHVGFGLASPSTVPAFLWSPHLQSANGEIYEAVNYQCSEKKLQQPVDVALVFIGRELLSTDVSSNQNSDPSLVKTLKNLYTASSFSLALPYIYISAPEEEKMENLLLSGLKEACAHNVGGSNIVFSDSCFVEDGTIQKLSNVQSPNFTLVIIDRIIWLLEKKREKKGKSIWLCSALRDLDSSIRSDQSHSDREIISELVSSVEKSGTKYAALYVSDPYWYTPYQTLQRFLAETATGNSTVKAATTCDELCIFKSSLLEGILLGIVLLIILISGLCCLAGIDTPTRFETPQD